jgi:hypothetical protein
MGLELLYAEAPADIAPLLKAGFHNLNTIRFGGRSASLLGRRPATTAVCA